MSKKPKKPVVAVRDPYWRNRRALGANCKPTVKESYQASGKAAKRTPKRNPSEHEDA